MPINKTGLANPNNYVLGRGNVWVANLDADGNPQAWRDLGNAPELSCSIDVEDLTHVSSRKGARVTDKRIILETTMNVNLSFDEVQDFENLALWLFGETSEPTNAAVAGFAEYQMVPDGALELARHYQIINSSGLRAFDIDTADLTVKTSAGVPVTLVLGTDYEVDTVLGTFFTLSTSTAIQTAITAGDGLLVTLTADAGASADLHQVSAMTETTKIVAIRFCLENPADADRVTEFVWPKVTLAADGDLALIGDEFAVAAMTGVAEQGDVGSRYAGQTLLITDPDGE